MVVSSKTVFIAVIAVGGETIILTVCVCVCVCVLLCWFPTDRNTVEQKWHEGCEMRLVTCQLVLVDSNLSGLSDEAYHCGGMKGFLVVLSCSSIDSLMAHWLLTRHSTANLEA